MQITIAENYDDKKLESYRVGIGTTTRDGDFEFFKA